MTSKKIFKVRPITKKGVITSYWVLCEEDGKKYPMIYSSKKLPKYVQQWLLENQKEI